MASLLTDLFYYTSNQIQYTDAMFEQMWNYDRNLFIQIVFYLRQHRNNTKLLPESSIDKTFDKSIPFQIIPSLKPSLRQVIGRGERKIFYRVIRWMSYHQFDALIKLLPYIPDYGYWKDLLFLLGTPAETEVINIFARQLILDYQSFNRPVPGLISMAAKWTPNEGSSSIEIMELLVKSREE